MRSLLSLWVALCFFASVAGTAVADENGYDVRSVRWGMTRADVLHAESSSQTSNGKLIKREDDLLIYNDKILDTLCRVAYKFDTSAGDGYLHEVMYLFEPQTASDAKNIYSLISSRLKEKYGDKELNEAERLFSEMMLTYKNDRTDVQLVNLYNKKGGVIVTYRTIEKAQKDQAKNDEKLRQDEERRKRDLSNF